MLKNFEDVFSYVNERYVFNVENYPVMANLTEQQQMIFALKHGLLHMLKSANKLGYEVLYEKKDIQKLQYLTFPNEKLGDRVVEFKKALLKTIVNIVSITHTLGFDADATTYFFKPSDEEMTRIMPTESLGSPILVTFKAGVDFFIETFAAILEKADHENTIDLKEVKELVIKLYKVMTYWFDDFWVRDFLEQIPSVMKSK